MKNISIIKTMLWLALSLVAAPAIAAPPASGPDRGYVFGPGDVIEVEVLGQPDFGKPRVRVRADGSVPLPMIGGANAAGLDPTSLAAEIERKLTAGEYYKNPSVNVDIVSYASHNIVVLGAVNQPGLVPVDRPYRLSEVLARVGGVRESGADQVVLTSANGDQRRFSVSSIAQGGPASDLFVSADDKVFVPNAELFYIYGQVNAPGSYELKDRMTLRQAMARGGGLTASGSDKRLTLYRNRQKLTTNLDTVLMPGDVVVVGERLF